jgi:hypothetical protein
VLLRKLKAKGFRSLKHIEVDFDRFTLLIGANDAGKSSVLDLLAIVLGDEQLDGDDFHLPPGTTDPVETVEVVLEFLIDAEKEQDVAQYALNDTLRIRKLFTVEEEKTHYWTEYPEDERLRIGDFERNLKAAEQEQLIRAFDPTAADDLSNKSQRAEWLREYAQSAPQTQGWTEIPRRGWRELLPRFFRYSTMGYDDPGSYIFNTLQIVFESVLHEGEEQRKLRSELRETRDKAQQAMNVKVEELLSYLREYDDRVEGVSYDPTIDFSRSLRPGEFLVDYGRGFHRLSKIGDGTKRKMFIATLDWERDVTLRQAAEGASLPPVIRGYDEPDTNLDYDAQRKMCKAIASIVGEERARTQAILCTHSPPMINQVPAHHIRLLSLCEGCTDVKRLETDGDSEVEEFLRESARELGITNTVMFYERCFILIEGATEENALPILYRKAYGHSLLEDGIRPINVKGNGAVKEFLRLLSRNRQEMTIILVDRDTEGSDEAALTAETLFASGFDQSFIDERLVYVGDQEFEDAFSDAVIARCLQEGWPKSEGDWSAGDVEPLRQAPKKFSTTLREDLVYRETEPALRSTWRKPVFGKQLARCCQGSEIPQEVRGVFELARQVAGCE